MRIILNVGLKIGRTNETIGLDQVERALRSIFGLALRYSISEHGSDTESTAVVSFEYRGSELGSYQGVHGLVRQLAQATQQEVIPVYKPERVQGKMLGATIDLDDSWGAFDPALFVMPDGSRLSALLPLAAA